MDLLSKIYKYINDNQLIKKGDLVVVGISGGLDSVVLTEILSLLRPKIGFYLRAAHFNHELRRGNKKDEVFVRKYCQNKLIPLDVGHWSEESKKESANGSLEEQARDARFNFFHNVLRQHKGRIIALAHHENDLAETILMKILRGTGNQGLRGILPLQDMKGSHFIRPLLKISRHELESYAFTKKLSYREDPTNKKEIFFRNKIRKTLLPLLEKQYNKGVRQHLIQLAESASLDFDFIENTGKQIYDKSANKKANKILLNLVRLQNQHPAIRRMVYRLGYEELKNDRRALLASHINELELLMFSRPSKSQVALPHEITATKTDKELIFYKTNS